MFVCLKNHAIFGHVFVEGSFDPVSSNFLFTCYFTDDKAASPELSTGIRPNPLGDGLPGRLAGPIPNTGYGPKFCIDVDSEHTRTNLPSRNMSFPQEYDATITASEDLNLPRHSGASSSSQHSVASRVPTLSKLGASGTGLTKVLADRDSVVGRTGIKETCAETVVSSLVESLSKGKRDRDLKRCANIERQAKSPQNPFAES